MVSRDLELIILLRPKTIVGWRALEAINTFFVGHQESFAISTCSDFTPAVEGLPPNSISISSIGKSLPRD